MDGLEQYKDRCQFISRCWRFIYSLELINNPWSSSPPTRLDLYLSGKALDGHMGKRSLFCENFPFLNNDERCNLCPAIDRIVCNGECFERDKELKKINNRFRNKKEGAVRNNLKKSLYGVNGRREKRVTLSRQMRRDIAARDKYNCVYCGRNLNYLKTIGVKMVFDHHVPLNKGGDNGLDNVVYSCFTCNSDKSDQLWKKGCRIGYYG